MLKTLYCIIIAASDWSVVIILNLPFSLTRSRGEYLRVVGILKILNLTEETGTRHVRFSHFVAPPPHKQ